jgi:prepilin-type processing-associated H-X9-DG protein
VVIAILGILAGLLLPALHHSKMRARVTQCASNYRQWGIAATLYADDNKGNFPSFVLPAYIGKNPWDVSTNMVPSMHAYSLTVPMMFCPARPKDFQDGQAWCLANLDRSMVTMDDLNTYLQAVFGDFGMLFHSWWVPRYAGDPADGGSLFPVPTPGVGDKNGWPAKMQDPMAALQPIMTDRCEYPDAGPPDVDKAHGGHPSGGRIDSVNLLFADSHVETHSHGKIKWRYSGSYYGTPHYSFY